MHVIDPQMFVSKEHLKRLNDDYRTLKILVPEQLADYDDIVQIKNVAFNARDTVIAFIFVGIVA